MADDIENLDEADYGVRATQAGELALQADLQHAGRLEAVPLEAVAAAKAAFIWRTLDGELAELTYDSQLDERAGAGARSAGTPTSASRLLTFEAPGLLVEVESLDAGASAGAGPRSRRRLVGQLVPPGPGRIEVRHRGGTMAVDADEVGRFTAEAVEPGPVSLRCLAAGATTAVVTDWVLVD